MMFGLGADTTGTSAANTTNPAAAAVPGIADGLKLWTSPGTAVTALTAVIGSPSVGFSSAALPFTLGLLAVPAIAVLALMSMSKGGR